MAATTTDIGRLARRLIRGCDRAALSTCAAADASPYASLVLVACGHDASPVLLISDLAEHTRNLAADPRAALLFDGTAGLADPLTGSRLTVQGRLERDDDPRLAARFLSRHPSAADYAVFGDFHVWRMAVTRAHLVAGFGRIHTIEAALLAYDAAAAAPLAAVEAEIVAHMNADHRSALDLYATRLLGRSGADWTMTGIDPEGLDLRRHGETARLDFDVAVHNGADARRMLVELASEARKAG
jgi:putative heme iron utilization protein